MQTKQLYSWLLPAEHSEPITPYFDSALRRPLFHRAKPGNEHTISERRRSSVESTEPRTSTSAEETETRRIKASAPALMYHA